MQGIKNVIFDLGGVIINLDLNRTIREFNRVSQIPFENIYTQAAQAELFNLFDKGKIPESDFFAELKKQIAFTGSDDVLIKAWNAMLLDVPEQRLDVLVEMKHNYNTFLLSNTCETHISAFERELHREHGVKNFNDYFDKVYYSCRLGMRKPDKEIFEFVLTENSLDPAETVFIDDSIQHVQSAGACGINAFLLEKNMEVGSLLKELKLL
ncbi:MAG: HAD family hydrolase [Bacteroidia bacterium]